MSIFKIIKCIYITKKIYCHNIEKIFLEKLENERRKNYGDSNEGPFIMKPPPPLSISYKKSCYSFRMDRLLLGPGVLLLGLPEYWLPKRAKTDWSTWQEVKLRVRRSRIQIWVWTKYFYPKFFFKVCSYLIVNFFLFLNIGPTPGSFCLLIHRFSCHMYNRS